jgi:uncharacterized protein YxjI
MSSQAPAPGWYADPTGQAAHRWWDGQQWTDHISSGGAQAAAPQVPPSPPAAAQPRPPGYQKSAPSYQQPAPQQQYQQQSVGHTGQPALFEARALMVSQKAKLIELTNEYDVTDPNTGALLARVVEVGQSGLKKAVRFLGNYDQFFTHRLEVRDPSGAVLLQMTRPAKVFKSRMQIAQSDGTPIGEIVQDNVFGKKRFGFSVGGQIIGGIRAENWRSWDFAIEDSNGAEVGRINKKWAGIGRELFTTADHYQVLIHQELPYPLRLMVIASAVTVDTALKQDE